MTELVSFTPQVVAQLPEDEDFKVETLTIVDDPGAELFADFLGFTAFTLPLVDMVSPGMIAGDGFQPALLLLSVVGTAFISVNMVENLSTIKKIVGRKAKISEWFSTVPFLGRLHKIKIVAQTGVEEYKVLTIGGVTNLDKVTIEPKDPIISWDSLYELETGEKVGVINE